MNINALVPNPRFIGIISDFKRSKAKTEKIGMALFGGALFGPYQFGWLYFMDRIGLLPLVNIMAATSVGALNGALVGKYLQNMDVALNIWLSIKKKEDVYERDLNIPTILWQGATGSESILLPKGLYNIINREFKDAKFSDLLIPLYTTATDLGPCEVDGGLGNNQPFNVLLDKGCTKVIALGCYPSLKTESLKVYGDNDLVIPAVTKSSALPVIFPSVPKDKKVSLVDVGKLLPQEVLNIFEERCWKEFALMQRIRALEGNPVEFIEGFPDKALPHSNLDCTHVKEDFEKGIDDAVAYLTPERVDGFLNS